MVKGGLRCRDYYGIDKHGSGGSRSRHSYFLLAPFARGVVITESKTMKTTIKNLKTGLWMGLYYDRDSAGINSITIQEVKGGSEAKQKGVVIQLDPAEFLTMMRKLRARAGKYHASEIRIDNADGGM